MPFITEEIWQSFREVFKAKEKSLMISKFPEKYKKVSNLKKIKTVMNVITGIRNIRSEMVISPKKDIKIIIEKDRSIKNLLDQNINFLAQLARVSEIQYLEKNIPPSAIFLINSTKIHVPLEGLINPSSEIKRNQKNLEKYEKSFYSLKSQIENKKFISNAPKRLIQERRASLKEVSAKISTTEKHIKTLEKIK